MYGVPLGWWVIVSAPPRWTPVGWLIDIRALSMYKIIKLSRVHGWPCFFYIGFLTELFPQNLC